MPPADTTLLAELTGTVDSSVPPPSPPGRWRRTLATPRSSPWWPIALKGLAIGAFLLGFSAVGAASMLARERGIHLASQLSPSATVVWLAPTPPVGEPSASVAAATSAPAPAPQHGGARSRAEADELKADCGPAGTLCGEPVEKEPPGLTSDGKVILNVAGPEVLTRLPGVGARRADAIVKLRERLKRFRRTSDLLRVRGIGVRSLKRMLPHLVLDPPKPESPPPPKPETP